MAPVSDLRFATASERHCAKIDVQTSSEGTTFIINFLVENK